MQTILLAATAYLYVIGLIATYHFGIWIRSYVFPAGDAIPILKQQLAGLPVSLMTMGIYGGYTAEKVLSGGAGSQPYDICLIAGNAIIFGMISRETLEKALSNARGGKTPDANISTMP